jgi:hypothetical protein
MTAANLPTILGISFRPCLDYFIFVIINIVILQKHYLYVAVLGGSRGEPFFTQARRRSVNLSDALRKIRLLKAVSVEHGSSPMEVETARNLIRTLMERFAVPTDMAPERPQVFQMSWVYWEHLLGEYGLELRRFGKRGNAQVGRDRMVLIRLDTGHWRVRQRGQGGGTLIAAGVGVETLREYMKRFGPRAYAFTTRSSDTIYRRR